MIVIPVFLLIDCNFVNLTIDNPTSPSISFTFNPPPTSSSLTLLIRQINGSNPSFTFPEIVKFPDGVLPVTTGRVNSEDMFSFYYDGTNYYGVAIIDLRN